MKDLQQVIKLCKRKDRKGQYTLYKYCYEFLIPVCYRYRLDEADAEALLNQGFLKILDNLDRLDNLNYFEYWAKRILINCITDDYRKRKSRSKNLQDYDQDIIENHINGSVYNAAISSLTVQEILDLLSQLPEPHRTIFNLFAIDQYSHKEIADEMNISEGTSKWYVHKARNILKEQINQLYNPIRVRHGSEGI